ncbi:MAG: hypothetical protein ACRDKS_04895 [Actinomycetota bacterium]
MPSIALEDRAPAEIQNAALAAMRAKGWVHSTGTVKIGDLTLRTVTHTGPQFGTQAITAASVTVELRFVGEVLYFKGNRQALDLLLAAPSSTAQKYAGKWLSVSVADYGYAELSEGLTMESLITSLALSGDMAKTKITKIAGTRVIGVTGGLPLGEGTATIYVALDGPPLVVRYAVKGKEGSATADLGDWGKHFNVKAPANATAAIDIAG